MYRRNRQPRYNYDKSRNDDGDGNSFRPRFKQQRSYYEADLKHVVELIPTKFTSYQIRQYTSKCWHERLYDELDKFFSFTKALRKAICGTKSETPMFIDPEINQKLNSYEPGSAEVYEYYAEEQTPRPDGSKNFDEQVWIFMYISALPVPNVEIEPTLQTFNILRNLSLEITMCETNYRRFDITKSNAGFLSKKESDIYMMSEMKQWEPEEEERAIKHAQGQHNKKLFYERKKIQEPVWEYYDKLRDSITVSNVNDLSNPIVLNAWQIVSHNPTFPENDSRFSIFFSRFKHSPKELAENLVAIRNGFYSQHLTFNECEPTKEEVAEWLLIIPLIDTLEQSIEFLSKEISFGNVTTIDTHYISFMKTVLTSSIELNNGILRKANMERSETTTFKRASEFVPYADIQLFNPDNASRIQIVVNRLTWENLNSLSVLLSAFNQHVLASVIEKELTSTNVTGFIALKIMIAIKAGVSVEKLKETIESKLNKRFGWNDDLSRLIGIALVCGIYGDNYCSAFDERTKFLVEVKHQSPIYLVDGIMKLQSTFPQIIEILKPKLVELSKSLISTLTTGYEIAIASDTVEILTGEEIFNEQNERLQNNLNDE